jgi:hypothetical protein
MFSLRANASKFETPYLIRLSAFHKKSIMISETLIQPTFQKEDAFALRFSSTFSMKL